VFYPVKRCKDKRQNALQLSAQFAETECTEWLSRVVQEKITQQIIEHEHPIPYQEEEHPVVHFNNNESAIPLLEMQQPMPLPQMQQQILQH
jgi:hypothetical protein